MIIHSVQKCFSTLKTTNLNVKTIDKYYRLLYTDITIDLNLYATTRICKLIVENVVSLKLISEEGKYCNVYCKSDFFCSFYNLI